MTKNLIFWLTATIIILFIFNNYNKDYYNNELNYSNFLLDIKNNKIKKIKINGRELKIIKKNNYKYKTYMPINDIDLINKLIKKNIIIESTNKNKPNIFISLLISWAPIILSTLIWILFIKQIKNSSKNSFFFNKNKTKILNKNINITFKDIAGCNEAKEEVKELVEFLKKPEKFIKLGGKIPKGILMIGPPGTGKTLLAKAIAGESKVPFYNICGSDFVEMFVGVGASRVRNMFKEAKKTSPCIIFIDEIDAVGRRRSISINGGNDEREQTLNQMLVEMDGFNNNQGIIIIAATNRPDILDPALLRPGRFDRKIIIDLPDLIERKQIIKIHIKKIPLNKDIDINTIAKSTPGFSGADLSNLINESALLAAKKNLKNISMKEIEISKDKIIMGSIRKSLIITNLQKESTAYHEAGHTIVGNIVPEHDPIYKVTIIPRGKSLGVTLFLPENDNLLISKKQLESKISTLYGGRIAEEIIYGKENISTGCSNDIKIATSIARNMVTKWGFSDKIGPLLYEQNEENLINNKIYNKYYISEYIYKIIDKEIKNIIIKNYKRAKNILIKNINILHIMKKELIKYETLNYKDIIKIMSINNNNNKLIKRTNNNNNII